MSRLAADVNSIAEAAANGLPFCGTDEKKEKTGRVLEGKRNHKDDSRGYLWQER